MIEFDVETTGLQPYAGNQEAFLWIFYDGDKAEAIPFSPALWKEYDESDGAVGDPSWEYGDNLYERHGKIQRWFDRVINDPSETIRAWNAKFDRAFAEAAGCFRVPGDGKWRDGMLTAHAFDERRSVALKAVASQLFGEEAADPQKQLKKWLNDENTRRRKVLQDADKGRVGSLRIKYVEEIECKHGGKDPLDCEKCEYGVIKKNRTRKATDDEVAALIAQAEELTDPKTGDYVRANYSHVPMEIMEPYALEDVILTRKVGEVYDARLQQAPGLQRVIDFETKAMDAIYAIEKRGLPADEPGYYKLKYEVEQNLNSLEERVHDLVNEADPAKYAKALDKEVEVSEDGTWIHAEDGGHRFEFNPSSSAQIHAALIARGADLTHMSQKDGKLPMDADNLRACDDELAQAILNFRSEYKVLSTYVKPMIGNSYVSSMNVYKEPFIAPDGRIHANYRQVGARTGRMSCSDPNMQNQPRDDLRLRYNIVADEGYSLVAVDLSNIEMVLFAAYCGEGRLLSAVQSGEDLHVLTAKMLGFRDRKRPGGIYESARQQGKTYNFSRIYGGGLRTIRRSFRCDMNHAKLLKQRFDDAYPEVRRLQAQIDYALADRGYVQDNVISGRRFRVPENESYKATNYVVQGTAAALLKYAVTQLHKDGVPMVALVHDEILAHVPTSDAQEAADLMVTRMTEFEGLKGVVPLHADADIVKRWSDAKPLTEQDTGRKYLFDPKWADVPRRYIEEAA